MKQMHKILSIILVLCLLLSLLPVPVLAEEPAQADQVTETETTAPTEQPTESEPAVQTEPPVETEPTAQMEQFAELTYSSETDFESDELYEAYAAQQFFGSISPFGTAAGERLTGDAKVLYDALVPIFRQIADGQRASATITVGQPKSGSPVDCEATFTGNTITSELLGSLQDALLSDLPYECYWYDKTTGCSVSYSYGETLNRVTLKFTVGLKYRGSDQYTADTTKTGAAKTAAGNAKQIVSKYAASSDYEKLLGYKNEICALVSYDHTAAGTADYFKTDLNPWQLISVFDGDSSTNVVCEGYSKAFLYLCDMSSFSGDVTCYTVSGYLNGGGHMWNIVDIGGKHYLADVTNSDTGTIGDDSTLFLAGGNGSAADGYRIGSTRFTYRSDTLELWGTGEDSILTLESRRYDPSSAPAVHVHNYDANHKCSCGAIGGICGEDLTWTLEDGVLTVSGTGEMSDFYTSTVPWKDYIYQITNIEVNEGVESIGNYAFATIDLLASVSLAESITRIGKYAFQDCTSLTDITLPKYADSIEYGAFDGCTSLNSVTLPQGVTIIEDYVFSNCSALTSISIPEGVERIGSGAFSFCRSLTDVRFPNSLKSIGKRAFLFCDQLTALHLPVNLSTIETEAFSQADNMSYIVLPTNILSIGTNAFEKCYTLSHVFYVGTEDQWKTVNIGNGNEYLTNAYRHYDVQSNYVSKLNSCTLTGLKCNICDICICVITDKNGTHNFSNGYCTDCAIEAGWEYSVSKKGTVTIKGYSGTDTNLVIPNAIEKCLVNKVGNNAFDKCKGIENLEMSDNITEIDIYAFYSSSLKNIALSANLTSISQGAFQYSSLESITIPERITKIGYSAFMGCSKLKKISFTGDAPQIDSTAFSNVTAIAYYPADNATWTADVMQNYGGSITWVPDCGGNHTLVIIPAVEATCSTTGLTEGVHCEVCGYVSREQEVVPIVDHKYDAFGVCRFCGIIGGNCGKQITNLKWSLSDNGVLTISGTGDMSGVDSSIYAPWNTYANQITSVVVEPGVETIGKNMLGLLPNLSSVSLPDTLRHIEAGAFHTNPALETITFPDSLETISNAAFQNSGLKTVTLPDNVWIGAYAFENCTSLKQVKLNSALNTDSNGSYLFQGCTALTDVTLGENVSRIGQYMFAGCTALKQITIPGNVKLLAANAFDSCTALEEVTLENGVEHIGPKAFANCTALQEFTIPGSVTEMEEAIFNRCENLDQIWFGGDAPVIDGSAFSTLKIKAYYPGNNATWTKDVRRYYGSTLIEWIPYNHTHKYSAVVTAPTCADKGYTTYTCSCGDTYRDSYVDPTGKHTYTDDHDTTCNVCGENREVLSVPMYRMYDANSGEHFYTGSTEERQFLINAGWSYEGVGFNFPVEGPPVYRLYDPVYGEHLYTMDMKEVNKLVAQGWNNEGVAFNSSTEDGVAQYRLHNPNEKRGAYHFTGSPEERDILIRAGWEYQGIGWYSCWE